MSPGDIAFWVRRAVYLSGIWDEMKEKSCTRGEMEDFLAIREGWISCSERNPEKEGWYLVRFVDGMSRYGIPQKESTVYWNNGWWDGAVANGQWKIVLIDRYVGAWRPLPKAYDEGGC